MGLGQTQLIRGFAHYQAQPWLGLASA